MGSNANPRIEPIFPRKPVTANEKAIASPNHFHYAIRKAQPQICN